MKNRTLLLVVVQIFLLLNSLIAQNPNGGDPLIPYQQNRSVLFGNDIILNDQPLQNQRNVVIRSAFNGWLYAGYTYINAQNQWPAAIILKSENNGLSWSILIDMVQAFDNTEMTSLDFVVVGDSINNLKLVMAFMIVQKNTSSGLGNGYVLRFNAVNGVYEEVLKEIVGRDISLAYDGMYPAINSSPHSIGCVYSINYFTVNKDSIKYSVSNNGGISFTTKKTLAGTSNHFVKTAIAYGRSLTQNTGRYFVAWEEKSAPGSDVGHIYTSHSTLDINSSFTTPLLVDSLIPGALNNVRNPAIACQISNYDNDSSDITEIILFDKFDGSSSYTVQGVSNKKASTSNYFTPFSPGPITDDIIQATIHFNPFDSTFIASYDNRTNQSLPYLKKDFNMSDPSNWSILSNKYNDDSNLSSPTPFVSLNISQKQGMAAWISEGSTGNGIALFDAPYLVTGLSEQKLSLLNPKLSLWPNPCSNMLNVGFELQSPLHVRITLSDLIGNTYASCGNQVFPAGKHCLKIDLSSYSCGLYLVELKTINFITSSKVLVIR